MKILTVADSHGNRVPLTIAAKNLNCFDKVIFLGDFFDHDYVEFKDQVDNFNSIMELKKNNSDKVTVLLGNHDANYIVPNMRPWQTEYADLLKNLILQNITLFDVAFLEGKWLFSHAGFSSVWLENTFHTNVWTEENMKELIEKMNEAIHNQDFSLLKFCGTDSAGDEITQNPLWIRPDSLMKVSVSGFNQVVGHSEVEDSERVQKTENGDTVLFLDSEPELRNVYAEIDTTSNFYEIKKYETIWELV